MLEAITVSEIKKQKSVAKVIFMSRKISIKNGLKKSLNGSSFSRKFQLLLTFELMKFSTLFWGPLILQKLQLYINKSNSIFLHVIRNKYSYDNFYFSCSDCAPNNSNKSVLSSNEYALHRTIMENCCFSFPEFAPNKSNKCAFPPNNRALHMIYID